MKSAQEIIDEIEREQKEIAMYKKIGSNTLQQWSKMGIEPYIDNETKKNEKIEM